jgi:hypothetical protein
VSSDHNDEHLERARREIRAEAAVLRQRVPKLRATPMQHASVEATGIDHTRRSYAIAELTDPPYEQFTAHAFRALLKRAPQAAEADAQNALLRAGAPKAEILGNLRWSGEGRRAGVSVHGLLPRYLVAKVSRIPVLGRLFDWGVALAALPMFVRHQRASDAALAASRATMAAALRDMAADHAALRGQFSAQDALAQQRLDDLRELVHGLAQARDELVHTIITIDEGLRERASLVETSLQSIEQGQQQLAGERRDELEFVRRRMYTMDRWFEALQNAFERIDMVAAERMTASLAFAARAANATTAADPARTRRQSEWRDGFMQRLPDHSLARVMTLACAADWNQALAAAGLQVLELDAQFGDAVTPREVLGRVQDASQHAVALCALPVLLRSLPLGDLLGEISRVLHEDGFVFIAFAPEPALLIEGLLGWPLADVSVHSVEAALTIAGFSAQRADAADGSPALFARRSRV